MATASITSRPKQRECEACGDPAGYRVESGGCIADLCAHHASGVKNGYETIVELVGGA